MLGFRLLTASASVLVALHVFMMAGSDHLHAEQRLTCNDRVEVEGGGCAHSLLYVPNAGDDQMGHSTAEACLAILVGMGMLVAGVGAVRPRRLRLPQFVCADGPLHRGTPPPIALGVSRS